MKNWTKIKCLLLCLIVTSVLWAQEDNSNKYLQGAVPEVNGKVVFSKEYSIPGMSQDEIFNRMLQWMDKRLKANQNNSRVLYSNKEEGQIVGTGDEWIVFSSTALSLDRTRILYQLTVICQPEKCNLSIEKIRFIYREGEEKYTAEEWITDKYALNKAKTKMVRGLAKWRRKTVDFAESYYLQAADALSAVETLQSIAVGQPKEDIQTKVPEANQVSSQAPMVIVPKRQVKMKDETNEIMEISDSESTTTPNSYQEIALKDLSPDAIQMSNGRLVIVIGSDPFNQTVMTANAGGSLGTINEKPVIFTILAPDQAHDQLDKTVEYTVRFYPNGSNAPTFILQCHKLLSPETPEGMPRTYAGEIVKALRKQE